MKHAFALSIFISLLWASTCLASPASQGLLDAEGCHSCQAACQKWGLKKGESHCHTLTPDLIQEYIHNKQSVSANMYGENIVKASNYISLSPNKENVIFVPNKKDLTGSYSVLSQTCRSGKGPFIFKKGGPNHTREIFDAKVDPSTPGFYTLKLKDEDYLALYSKNKKLLIFDKSGDVLCAGSWLKTKFSLFCKTSFTSKKSDRTKRYCRTALVAE